MNPSDKDELNLKLCAAVKRFGWIRIQENRERFQALIEEGASPDGDEAKNVPVTQAILAGRTANLRLLLTMGASPNLRIKNLPDEKACNSKWPSPLHLAAFVGDANCSLVLIAAGADRAALNASAQTPADLARWRGHEKTAKHIDHPLHYAAGKGLTTECLALLDSGILGNFARLEDYLDTSASTPVACTVLGNRVQTASAICTWAASHAARAALREIGGSTFKTKM